MTPEAGSSAEPLAGSATMADRVLERMAPVIAAPPRWQLTALMAAAIVQIVLAVPWLVGADPSGLLGDAYPSHLTRDGALGLVIGAVAVVVARRPHHALAAFVAGASVLAVQLSTGIIDGHFHRVLLWVEITHAPTVVIVVLLAMVSRPERGWKTALPIAAATDLPVSRASVQEAQPLNGPAPLRLVPPASGD